MKAPAPAPVRLEWLALSLAVALAVALLALSAALGSPGGRTLADRQPDPREGRDGCPYGLPAPAAFPIRLASA
jgi:hypothetical protein